MPIVIFLAALVFISCQKEVEFALQGNPGGGGGGGGTGGGTGGSNFNSSCNSATMKIKKWQATFDTEHYIEADWNTDGTINKVKMNVPLSDYRNATYIYSNDRISQAVLRDNQSNTIEDTVIFHYNAAGQVDSMYMKNDDWFNIKLDYLNGKIKKFTRIAAGDIMFYWDVETDAKGNITKAIEWWNTGTGFSKESTYTFTRDDRKNPFSAVAPYMFYLDDDYNIFWYWGPNNYTDQRYQDHTGSGIDLTTGYKFKYNANCYPESSQTTIQGQVIFTDPDYLFTYF